MLHPHMHENAVLLPPTYSMLLIVLTRPIAVGPDGSTLAYVFEILSSTTMFEYSHRLPTHFVALHRHYYVARFQLALAHTETSTSSCSPQC